MFGRALLCFVSTILHNECSYLFFMVQVLNTSIVLTFVVRNIIISTQYLVVLDRQILQRYILKQMSFSLKVSSGNDAFFYPNWHKSDL